MKEESRLHLAPPTSPMLSSLGEQSAKEPAIASGTVDRLALSRHVLDVASGELLTNTGQLAGLRKQALHVLCVLGARPGQVVGKEELMRRVWPDVIVGETSLAQAIADIRRVLGDADHRLVRTVARRGYMLVPDSASAPLSAGGDTDPAMVTEPPQAVASMVNTSTATSSRPLSNRTMLAGLLVLLVVAGVWLLSHWRSEGDPASARLPHDVPSLSIVVLPLDVDGPSAASEWLANALLQDLIGELARLEGSFVIARDTAATFKGKAVDPRSVARELRVRYVVRGSVRHDGDVVQLNLSLIDGERGAQRWADKFVAERAQLNQTIDDFVLHVARALSVEVYRSAGDRVVRLSPTAVMADDLAMRGFALWHRGYNRDNLSEALSVLEQAVAIDPNSVRGWGGISFVTLNGVMNGWLPDRAAALKRIEVAGEQLDRLDPNGHLSYQSRVIRSYLKKDWPAMLRLSEEWADYHRNAVAKGAYGLALILNGRAEEGIAPLELALRLSPRDVFRAEWHYRLALANFIVGRYGQARDSGMAAEASNPALPWAPIHAAALVRLGDKVEGQRIFDEFVKRHPGYKQAQMMQRLGGTAPSFVEGRDRLFASLMELGL